MKDKKGPNLGCTPIGCIVLYLAFCIGTWQAASVGGKAGIAAAELGWRSDGS
jgi:hypothetical protein